MTFSLLPKNFDDLLKEAVETFWSSRATGSDSQEGGRGSVIAGKNLDGFIEVTKAVATHCGIPEEAVFAKGRRTLTLPGYYRPHKNWDALIILRGRLLAVLEFKSQVGSFGNNFNNRAEEVIGNAADLWVANAEGAFAPEKHLVYEGPAPTDPRPPFLGYLMLLEDCEDSTKAVAADAAHYPIFPEFRDASYAQRYRILCERLMEQGLYNAAALVLSPMPGTSATVAWRSLSAATDVRNLFAELAGRLLAAIEARD
ncbi:MAG: PaeR7I family type II restriction endonuclease [Longimicrobiales bacterium]